MSNVNLATEQLLELLLTLKKTTPAAARGILNNQPAIAYALITLMVTMNAIDIEVFQKTLAEFGATNTPEPSLATPYTHVNGHGYGQQQAYSGQYQQQPSSVYPGYPPTYGGQALPHQPTPPVPAPSSNLTDTLASIPDEQKALIMRVLSMTPEQINMLPPTERSTYIQIRATLGIPTG